MLHAIESSHVTWHCNLCTFTQEIALKQVPKYLRTAPYSGAKVLVITCPKCRAEEHFRTFKAPPYIYKDPDKPTDREKVHANQHHLLHQLIDHIEAHL